ncbi:hypothetical protein [Epilithonimonas hominis]|nr:hypothetical protein [Epilithonimonas hominis]
MILIKSLQRKVTIGCPTITQHFATIPKGTLLMQSRKTVELDAVAADEEK